MAQCEGSYRIPDYVALWLEPSTSHNSRSATCLRDVAWHASNMSSGNSEFVYRKLEFPLFFFFKFFHLNLRIICQQNHDSFRPSPFQVVFPLDSIKEFLRAKHQGVIL